MGFDELGRSLYKVNTRLRRNVSSKYFRSADNVSKGGGTDSDSSRKYLPKPGPEYPVRTKKYFTRINLLTLFVIVMMTIAFYYIMVR